MVLDIDPGQPEYSPPGVISLCKITAPNLSPSFCHPTLSPPDGQQLRAHAIASVTPAQDPAHFIECVLDLFTHYQRSANAKCPLVINTPGWIQGTGLDILTELITSIRPAEVIYTSQDGPDETITSLQSACAATTTTTTTTQPTPFSTLPSQPHSDNTSPSRTALHLRTMQTMSYFHLLPSSSSSPTTTWDPTPLTALRPWRVRYSSSSPNHRAGIDGILFYHDDHPAPSLLPDAINGTILALVRLTSSSPLLSTLPKNSTSSTSLLPLIPNPQAKTLLLPPSTTHFLSLVLVRGVDTQKKELHLLTPLPKEFILSELAAAADEGGSDDGLVVLVAGRFDTPHWAYSEDLYRASFLAAASGKGGEEEEEEDGDGEEEEEEEGVEDTLQKGEVPWVEMLHGSRGRGVGGKVWRVRRDLGRS